MNLENPLEQNLTQKDLFVLDEGTIVNEEFVNSKDAFKNAENIESIPGDYIEVKLDSLGKLDAPAILHFRNYTGKETSILAMASKSGNYLEKLISCLNSMVYEKFDCALLEEQELIEIMLSIYQSFWSVNLEDYRYLLNESLSEELINKEENIGLATIPIKSLNTFPIPQDFKEPIKISINGKVVKFRLVRLKDGIVAKKFIKEKYLFEERKYSNIEDLINKKKFENIDPVQLEEYEQYLENRELDLTQALQCQCLVEVNGKKLESFKEKFEAYSSVDTNFWFEYDSFIRNLKYGVDPEVEFYPDTSILNIKDKDGEIVNKHLLDESGKLKPIKRRFLFQPMDFLPSVGLQNFARATISFGD